MAAPGGAASALGAVEVAEDEEEPEQGGRSFFTANRKLSAVHEDAQAGFRAMIQDTSTYQTGRALVTSAILELALVRGMERGQFPAGLADALRLPPTVARTADGRLGAPVPGWLHSLAFGTEGVKLDLSRQLFAVDWVQAGGGEAHEAAAREEDMRQDLCAAYDRLEHTLGISPYAAYQCMPGPIGAHGGAGGIGMTLPGHAGGACG
jgi:hypothetical protein